MKILRPKPVLMYPLNDKQIVFDYVYHHFIVENNPLGYHAEFDSCVYDTPSGGCAIGCLLPEDLRKNIGESQFPINHIYELSEDADEFRIRLTEILPLENIKFFRLLQREHDCSNGNHLHFKNGLHGFAYNEKLTLPVEE